MKMREGKELSEITNKGGGKRYGTMQLPEKEPQLLEKLVSK